MSFFHEANNFYNSFFDEISDFFVFLEECISNSGFFDFLANSLLFLIFLFFCLLLIFVFFGLFYTLIIQPIIDFFNRIF